MDSIKQYVNENCEISESKSSAYKETIKDLWAGYSDYCDQLGLYCTPKREFIKRLKNDYKLEPCDIRVGKKHDKGLKYIMLKVSEESDNVNGKSTNPPNPPDLQEVSPIREKIESYENIVDFGGLVDNHVSPVLPGDETKIDHAIKTAIQIYSEKTLNGHGFNGAKYDEIIEGVTSLQHNIDDVKKRFRYHTELVFDVQELEDHPGYYVWLENESPLKTGKKDQALIELEKATEQTATKAKEQ
jgi:hypothetical protein